MSGRRRRISALVGASVLAAMLAVPAGAAGTTRYIDDDGLAGPNGCNGTTVVPKRLQPVINAAAPGDTIRVCPGTYSGFVAIAKAGLTIAPASSGQVTLKPPADRDPNDTLVRITANNVTFRGMRLLIPAGPITSNECDLRTVNGIRAENAKNLTLRNNRITGDESATSWFCGLEFALTLEKVTGTVSGNTIRNMVNTAIDVYNSTALTLASNTVQHVRPLVGESRYIQAVVIRQATVTMTDNVIETVVGTTDEIDVGLTADYGAKLTAQRNTVSGATIGLWIAGTADGVIEDNTFSDGSGDGVYVHLASGAPTSPSVVLRRNVVTGFDGRGVFSSGSSGLAIRYNDFSGNGDVDCQDYTVPSEHIWIGNKSSEASDPVGLCAPENAGPN